MAGWLVGLQGIIFKFGNWGIRTGWCPPDFQCEKLKNLNPKVDPTPKPSHKEAGGLGLPTPPPGFVWLTVCFGSCWWWWCSCHVATAAAVFQRAFSAESSILWVCCFFPDVVFLVGESHIFPPFFCIESEVESAGYWRRLLRTRNLLILMPQVHSAISPRTHLHNVQWCATGKHSENLLSHRKFVIFLSPNNNPGFFYVHLFLLRRKITGINVLESWAVFISMMIFWVVHIFFPGFLEGPHSKKIWMWL